MGLKMKNLNIRRVHRKLRFLGGIHEKPTHIGGNCLKRGELGQFADLRGKGGLAKKRWTL